MADVVLSVGGKRYSGWKTIRVTRGIEAIAGSFSLSVSERWANQDEPWPINEDDECTVSLEGVTVLTGFVDSREPAFDENSHELSVSGRDKTGDLVDCSALTDPIGWEFKGLTLQQFAEKLCAPHDVKVSLQSGLSLPKPPAKFHVDPGETAFNVLEHACRKSGVLPVADGKGGLVLTRAGASKASTALVEGKNLKSLKGKFDKTNRFSEYIVLAQHAASDDFFAASASHIRATATDPNVRASRKLVVRPEGNATVELAKARAQWEAIVRAARAGEVTAVVQGWKQDSGKLWEPNTLVSVKSPKLRIDSEMLITQVVYEASDSAGTISTLALKRPDAFKPEPSGVQGDKFWQEVERHGKGV